MKYNSNTYSANATFNYTLPSTFKIEYERQINTVTNNNSTYIGIGESTSRLVLIGKVLSRDARELVRVRTSSSGSGDIDTYGSTITASNDYQSIYISFDGTNLDFNNDITITNLNGVSLTKLVNYGTWRDTGVTSGNIRNIKIKPL